MKILQIIGLPCSGKSTVIRKILEKFRTGIWLDISVIESVREENRIKFLSQSIKSIRKLDTLYDYIIIESACGFRIESDYIIKLEERDIELIRRRFLEREGKPLSQEYIFSLDEMMIIPTIIVYSPDLLEVLIETILEEKVTNNERITE